MEQLKTAIADAQAWFARLTTRERRLVAFAGSALALFILFLMMFSFSNTAARYRRQTADKLEKLAQVETLAASYGEAQTLREGVERELSSNNVKLISYIDEKGTAAGLSISTQIPKNEVPIGDGKILESSVELTLTDLERSILNKLDDNAQAVDELIGVTGLTASQVLATLSVLEMRRLVRRMPGHRFVRA